MIVMPGPTPAPPARERRTPRAGHHPHMTDLERKIRAAREEARLAKYPNTTELAAIQDALGLALDFEQERQKLPPDTGPD